MLTLREFIEKINFREHFRVYQMNMDGLIYESYYTVHSPYFFDKEHEEKREYFNDKYYSDNKFCDDVGMNTSTAISLFIKAVLRENRIPFEISNDPFYSKSNIEHLKRGISAITQGKGREHELIEE